MADDPKIRIEVEIDEAGAKSKINSQLDKLKTNKVKLDVDADNIAKSVENAASKANAKINISVDSKAITNFSNTLNKLGLNASVIKGAISGLQQEVVQVEKIAHSYKSVKDSAEKLLQVQIKGVDSTGRQVVVTQSFSKANQELLNTSTKVVSAYNKQGEIIKANNAAEKQQNQIQAARLKYLDQQTSKLKKIYDSFANPNTEKPLLDNKGLISEYEKQISAINQLRSSGADLNAETQSSIRQSIDAFQRAVKAAQKEAYAPTSLRTKDVPTVKAIQAEGLNELELSMKRVGSYTKEAETALVGLRSELAAVSDRSSLTGFLNQLDVVKARFKTIREETKSGVGIGTDPNYWQGQFTDSVKAMTSTNDELLKMRQYYTEMGAEAEKANKQQVVDDRAVTNAKKLAQEMLAMKANWSAFTKSPELMGKWQEIFDTLPVVKHEEEVKKARLEYQLLSKTIIAQGLNTKKFWGQITDNIKKFSSWFAVGGFVASGVRVIKQMFTNVTELDGALTQLRKVTDETDATYSRFLESAKTNAVKLGTTLVDLVKSTADFARLGFSISEAAELAKAANIYLNVGDDIANIDESTSTIISTLKGFGLAASDAILVVDKLNDVSNKYAVSSGDLGKGLQNSAAALSLAGVDLDHTIAMLTAMTEITQDASESGEVYCPAA